jgi:outer membrane receptor protein involved in Fe transport
MFNKNLGIKMKKILLLGILSLIFSYKCFSETTTLIGKVVDNTGNNPLPGANITLHKQIDSNLVTGKIADKNGDYKFENLNPGDYYMKISYVGFDSKYVDISLDNNSKLKDMGLISLVPGSTQTGNVIVEAEKPQVQFSGGKTIINIDKNIVNSNGSAFDILKNTPSLEITADGQVKLRGSTNFRILIDGKKAGGDASDPGTLLKQIPASSLENIEIITNPSAKYDAEGSGGIINLIAKRKKDDGLNGLVSGNFGSEDRYNTSVNMNYKEDFVNIFGSYDFQREINNTNQLLTRDDYLIDASRLLNLDSKIRHQYYVNSGKLGSDFYIDNSNKLTLYGTYKYVSQGQSANMLYNNSVNNKQTELISRTMNLSQPNTGWDLVANYVKNFEKNGMTLTFDGYYSYWGLDMNNLYNQKQYLVEGNPQQPYIFSQKNFFNSNINYYALQTDFVYPISESSKIETGLKAELNSFDSDYKLYNSQGISNEWNIDTSYSVFFKNTEDIYAVYFQLSDKISDFEYSLGLRSELTYHNSKIERTGYQDKNDYIDYFPSASLSYSLDQSNQIQLSYSSRISRPQAFSYNPVKQIKDPFNVVIGNPALKPEHTDSYELGYIFSFGKHTINPVVFYKFAKDNIFMSAALSPTENVMYMTYNNDSDGEFYGTDLNYQGQLAEGLNLNLNFSYYMQNQYVHKGNLKYTNGEYTWDGRFSVSYYILKNLVAQASGAFYPETVTPLGKRYGYQYVDFAVKYDFWDRTASLNFRATDPFESLSYGGLARGNDFLLNNNYYPQSRHFSLGFSYKINNYNRKQERKGGTQVPSGGEMI